MPAVTPCAGCSNRSGDEPTDFAASVCQFLTYAIPGTETSRDHSLPKRTMSEFWRICCEYGRFYQEGTVDFWRSMRPASYSVVLAGVWLIGFILLKSGARR